MTSSRCDFHLVMQSGCQVCLGVCRSGVSRGLTGVVWEGVAWFGLGEIFGFVGRVVLSEPAMRLCPVFGF